MTWSPPDRTGSFASVITTPVSPTASIFIGARPRQGPPAHKLNVGPSAGSLRELREADGRVQLPGNVRGHRARGLRRFPRVGEDPHELHVCGLGEHVLPAHDPRLEEVPPRVVDVHADAALAACPRTGMRSWATWPRPVPATTAPRRPWRMPATSDGRWPG